MEVNREMKFQDLLNIYSEASVPAKLEGSNVTEQFLSKLCDLSVTQMTLLL